jgi:hypothetical protein
MRLTDEQLRDILSRAEEIQSASLSGRDVNAEMEAVIQAGEAVGLQRTAVERALRERLNMPFAPPAVGELVWAKSADDRFYVAELLATSPTGARVRFLQGSEHTVSPDDFRGCSFLPGERVVCHWPWWGPWTCTVLSYDAANGRIHVSDGWGDSHHFPISEVWLKAPKPEVSNRRRVYLTLFGWGAGAGGLLGAALTWLLMR